VWLLAAAAGNDNPVPSADRAIQNLAFQVSDVDAAMTALKDKQVKAVVEPRSLGDLRYGFIEDPNGVRIEIIKP
jgi:catechol 2,3-dioxygenase-like lactoylglutathione lyase family enzyme